MGYLSFSTVYAKCDAAKCGNDNDNNNNKRRKSITIHLLDGKIISLDGCVGLAMMCQVLLVVSRSERCCGNGRIVGRLGR
jgi:hypothetical protein